MLLKYYTTIVVERNIAYGTRRNSYWI